MSNKEKMSSLEIRTSFILASIYALRMLGMFLILPIFAIYASGLEGNPTSFQIGLALGIYGLTQALFQIPFGMSSDYFGRKKVIYFGFNWDLRSFLRTTILFQKSNFFLNILRTIFVLVKLF